MKKQVQSTVTAEAVLKAIERGARSPTAVAKAIGCNPYSLRHTFASMESDAGIETTSLSRLMGHTTNRTRYVTNTSETFRRAVSSVEDRIKVIVTNGIAGDETR